MGSWCCSGVGLYDVPVAVPETLIVAAWSVPSSLGVPAAVSSPWDFSDTSPLIETLPPEMVASPFCRSCGPGPTTHSAQSEKESSFSDACACAETSRCVAPNTEPKTSFTPRMGATTRTLSGCSPSLAVSLSSKEMHSVAE